MHTCVVIPQTSLEPPVNINVQFFNKSNTTAAAYVVRIMQTSQTQQHFLQQPLFIQLPA